LNSNAQNQPTKKQKTGNEDTSTMDYLELIDKAEKIPLLAMYLRILKDILKPEEEFVVPLTLRYDSK
jgi:hypothetical protein